MFPEGQPFAFDIPPTVEQGITMVPFRVIFERLGLAVGWDPTKQTVSGDKEGLGVRLSIGSEIAVINGEEKPLPLAPKVMRGNTMVLLRFVSEASGRVVTWDRGTKTVYIGPEKADESAAVEVEPVPKKIEDDGFVTPTTTGLKYKIIEKTNMPWPPIT